MAMRLSPSTLIMLVIRSSDMTTPPTSATLPPAVPVPRPRGITGILCVLQSLMMLETSSVLSGKTTAIGLW